MAYLCGEGRAITHLPKEVVGTPSKEHLESICKAWHLVVVTVMKERNVTLTVDFCSGLIVGLAVEHKLVMTCY